MTQSEVNMFLKMNSLFERKSYMVIRWSFTNVVYIVTRIILRPLSALSLDEVNIAKRNITTGLFGLCI
jgi:hypothetical protein